MAHKTRKSALHALFSFRVQPMSVSCMKKTMVWVFYQDQSGTVWRASHPVAVANVNQQSIKEAVGKVMRSFARAPEFRNASDYRAFENLDTKTPSHSL